MAILEPGKLQRIVVGLEKKEQVMAAGALVAIMNNSTLHSWQYEGPEEYLERFPDGINTLDDRISYVNGMAEYVTGRMLPDFENQSHYLESLGDRLPEVREMIIQGADQHYRVLQLKGNELFAAYLVKRLPEIPQGDTEEKEFERVCRIYTELCEKIGCNADTIKVLVDTIREKRN